MESDYTRIIEWIRERRAFYTEKPIPPCRVCGGELALGRTGDGRREYYCYGHGKEKDKAAATKHYWDSQYTVQHRSSYIVLPLLEILERTSGKRQIDKDFLSEVWAILEKIP